MTDLKNQFSNLRSDEITRLRPPGADAVRRTVRRRRQRRTVAAVAAIAVLAGGWAAGVRPGLSDRPVAPAASDSTTLMEPVQRAEELISSIGSNAEIGRVSQRLSTSLVPLLPAPAGDHLVIAVCTGPGVATVFATIRKGKVQRTAARLRLVCDSEPPVPVEAPVSVGPGEQLSVRVEAADPKTADQAGYAIKLTSADSAPLPGDKAAPARRTVIAAATALAADHDEVVGSTYGASAPGGSVTGDGAAGLGNYQFRIACSGPGSIAWRVKVASGNSTTLVLKAGTKNCSDPAGTATDFEVDTGGELQVELDPDAAAVGSAVPWNYQIALPS